MVIYVIVKYNIKNLSHSVKPLVTVIFSSSWYPSDC